MQVLQKPTFQRVYKKLHANSRLEVDSAIREIMGNPLVGDAKVGDLAGVRVYKFRMINQLTILAYTYEEEVVTLTLLALGSQEK